MPAVPDESAKLNSAQAKRLGWALDKYGHLLAEAVGKDTSAEARDLRALPEAEIPAQVIHLLMEKADPTQAKTMTGWLVKQYATGGLRLEDTGTAHETLKMFQIYAPRLPEGRRDLGQYQSLAEAWDAVIHLAEAEQDKLGGKAQKVIDKAKAHAESRILRQDPDGFTIAVPLTEFAATWWGKGTRWCTSARKNNQFWTYHKDAPLIVMVIPELGERGKFQCWATEKELALVDVQDKWPVEKLIGENWRRFESIFRLLLLQHGAALTFVPNKLRTEELCRIAVEQTPYALRWVPEHVRTAEILRITVAQNAWALGMVEADLRTEELCRIALVQAGGVLRLVPQQLRTETLCRIAVERDGAALEWVPEILRTEELCKIAVAQNWEAFQFLPNRIRKNAVLMEEFGRIIRGTTTTLRKTNCIISPEKKPDDTPAWNPSLLDRLGEALRGSSDHLEPSVMRLHV